MRVDLLFIKIEVCGSGVVMEIVYVYWEYYDVGVCV